MGYEHLMVVLPTLRGMSTGGPDMLIDYRSVTP